MTDDHHYAIDITVASHYIEEQSMPAEKVYSFAYTVTITNRGTVPTQLISRHWIIQDDHGYCREIKGLGVVGHQPLLKPGESFQYTSASQLPTPGGTMQGSYFFVTEDGQRFDAEIPQFPLNMPRTLH
ncbi:MAG: Co2+/Mg2+ efflux protein ApaG [Lautropia sp.]|nr:Co2+/Mg2+ efflux protein ApaG [Lautropia sp.]